MESKPQTAEKILAKASQTTNDLMVSTEVSMQQVMNQNRPRSRSRSATSQMKTAESSSISSMKSCDYPTGMEHTTRTAVSPYDTFSPVRSAKSPAPTTAKNESTRGPMAPSRGRSATPKSTVNSLNTAVSEVSNTCMNSGYSPNQISASLRTARRSETNLNAVLDRSDKTAKSPASVKLTPRDAWASVCPSPAPKVIAASHLSGGSEKIPKKRREGSARSVSSERQAITPRTAVSPGLFGPRRTPKKEMKQTIPMDNSILSAKSDETPKNRGGKSTKSDQSASSRQATPFPKSDRAMDTARSTKSHERQIGALRSGKLFGATGNKELQKKAATSDISVRENSTRSTSLIMTPTVTAVGRTPNMNSRRSSLCTAIPEETAGTPLTWRSNISVTGTPGSIVSNTQNDTSAYSITGSRSSSCNSTQRTPNPISSTRSTAIESVYQPTDMGGLRSAAAIQPQANVPIDYFGAQAPIIEKPAVPKKCITYNIREAEIPKTPNVRAWTPEPKNRSVTPYTSPGEYLHEWTPVPKSMIEKKKNKKNLDRSASYKSVSGKKLKLAGEKAAKSPAVLTAKDINTSLETARSITPTQMHDILNENTNNEGVLITTQLPDGSFKVELKVSVRVSSESGRFSISGRAPDGLKTSKVTVNGESIYNNQ